jgi:hypothetical protein
VPSTRSDYRHTLRVAATVERQLGSDLRRGFARLRSIVTINDLAMALASKNVNRALVLVTKDAIASALEPARSSVERAVRAGMKSAARKLVDRLDGEASS